ncbi:unnamed protein product, partial [Polarella glacialis]
AWGRQPVPLPRMEASASAFVFLCVLLLLPDPILTGIPCAPQLSTLVEVGDDSASIGLSRTIKDGEYQSRDCAFVTTKYEGEILLGCDDGILNSTAEGCIPRRCQTSDSLAVRMGQFSILASPREIISSGGMENRLCRELNPLFRGSFQMFCDFGELTVDTHNCVTQWDPMPTPPWTKRSRHTGVPLSGGSVLMLGGLGEAGPLAEEWEWTPRPGTVEGSWAQSAKNPPWSGRFGVGAVLQVKDGNDEVTIMGGNDGQNRRDSWRWHRRPNRIEVRLDESEPTGSQSKDCTELASGQLYCHALAGVSGRRWKVSHYLESSTEIHIEMLHDGGRHSVAAGGSAAGVGAAVIAVQLDGCRQIFRADGGSWSTTGCTGEDPPWAREGEPSIRLGPAGAAMPGQLRSLRVVLDRENLQVILYSA